MNTKLMQRTIKHLQGTIETSHLSTEDVPSLQTDWSVLSASKTKNAITIEHIWSVSQDIDDAAFRPREGWWLLSNWATHSKLLLRRGKPVGVVAINVPSDGEIAEGRLALLPEARHETTARQLVEQIQRVAKEAGSSGIRLFIPAQASWARNAVQQLNFSLARTQQVMAYQLPTNLLPLREVDGIRIRQLRAGEESTVLEVLNKAWAGTWNFRPLTLEALRTDLEKQREGFLLAVSQTNDSHILGTVHALFDRNGHNLDQHPYAWISNLTVDPSLRGKGLGRMLLASGLNHLQDRGAISVMLGVDGNDTVPTTLYRSTGFEVVGTVEIWEQ